MARKEGGSKAHRDGFIVGISTVFGISRKRHAHISRSKVRDCFISAASLAPECGPEFAIAARADTCHVDVERVGKSARMMDILSGGVLVLI